MPAWEYKHERVFLAKGYSKKVSDAEADLVGNLNRLGADGWELVSVQTVTTMGLNGIFKRPKP